MSHRKNKHKLKKNHIGTFYVTSKMSTNQGEQKYIIQLGDYIIHSDTSILSTLRSTAKHY